MADLVNLRRARKAKARQAAEATAQVNRVASGRIKSERQTVQIERALAQRQFDGHLRSPAPPEPDAHSPRRGDE